MGSTGARLKEKQSKTATINEVLEKQSALTSNTLIKAKKKKKR